MARSVSSLKRMGKMAFIVSSACMQNVRIVSDRAALHIYVGGQFRLVRSLGYISLTD
jgi:hypothetical protein